MASPVCIFLGVLGGTLGFLSANHTLSLSYTTLQVLGFIGFVVFKSDLLWLVLACLLFEAVSHSLDRAGLELSGVLLASAHLGATDQEL